VSLLGDSGTVPLPESHPDFAELASLRNDLLNAVGGQQMFEEKLRSFFRSAIDEVIDTARTGRFFLEEAEKTEKTYLGTKFEILLRDWLQVPRGVVLDLLIGGREVDVKSTTGGGSGWMIPLEALDQFCILLRVNEKLAKCAVGLVRARPAYLRSSTNQDKKTSFSAAGTANIWWLASNFAYTPNFWSLISADLRQRIMSSGAGTKRLATLFENCLGMPVSRVQVAAIAAQDDFMKRIRRNGGARDILAPKGIAILYSETDRALMHQLGLTFGSREFLSHRATTEEQATLLRDAGHID
jgi:Restriction endonuclease NaeI